MYDSMVDIDGKYCEVLCFVGVGLILFDQIMCSNVLFVNVMLEVGDGFVGFDSCFDGNYLVFVLCVGYWVIEKGFDMLFVDDVLFGFVYWMYGSVYWFGYGCCFECVIELIVVLGQFVVFELIV